MAGDTLIWLDLQLSMAFQVKFYSDSLEDELKHFILWDLCLHSSVKIKDQTMLFAVRKLKNSQQNYAFPILQQL